MLPDPKLTFNVYSHLTIPDKAKAIEAMPPVSGGKRKRKRANPAG